MQPKTKTVEAIIISRRDWGEADRLLTAFSSDTGKIRIVARGARKLKSKMACHVEPFCYGKFSLHQGKGYQILTGAESTTVFECLTGNMAIYEDATYLCELVDMVSQEEEPNKKLFKIFKETLSRLSELAPKERDILLRVFEFHLLESIGYETQFTKCKKCHKELRKVPEYWGNFEGVLCEDCGKSDHKIDLNTLKVLRLIKKGHDPLNIKGIEAYNAALKNVVLGYLYDILPRMPKAKKYE